MGGLTTDLFLIVLKAGKSKIKVLFNLYYSTWFPSQGSIPNLQMAAFFVCLHMARRERERERVSFLVFLFIWALIPYESPTLMNSSKPNSSQWSHLQIPPYWRLVLQKYEFCWGYNSLHSSQLNSAHLVDIHILYRWAYILKHWINDFL